jgi:hypothetical protein
MNQGPGIWDGIIVDRVHDGAKAIVSSSAHAVDCGIVKVRLQRPERHKLRLLSILEQHMEYRQFYVLPAYQHCAIHTGIGHRRDNLRSHPGSSTLAFNLRKSTIVSHHVCICEIPQKLSLCLSQ